MPDYENVENLDDALLNVIETWAESRKRYWPEPEGTDPHDVSFVALADELARIALTAVDDLRRPDEIAGDGYVSHFARLDFSSVSHTLQIDLFRATAREYLQIKLAERHCTGSAAMANRCLELVEVILEANPNESVRRFLQRLSRTYVAGFLPEAVIMCRAVLENAVRDVFQRKSQPLPNEMKARLDWAHMCGWLTQRERANAWTVWERGNTAVHKDPSVTNEVLATIRMTLGVLNELYGA